MERLALLFLLAVSLSSAKLTTVILLDSANCVHLRCRWRGEGDLCKPAHSVREAHKRGFCGLNVPFIYKGQTDADLIARVKRELPFNTVTVDNIDLDEECEKKKQLCCNGAGIAFIGLSNPRALPKSQCSVQNWPIDI